MCGLASRNLAPVIQTFDSAQPVPVQIVWTTQKDVSRINSEGGGAGGKSEAVHSYPRLILLIFPYSLTPSRRTPLSKRLEQAR